MEEKQGLPKSTDTEAEIRSSVCHFAAGGDYQNAYRLTQQLEGLQRSEEEKLQGNWAQVHRTKSNDLETQRKAHKRLLKAWWDEKIVHHTERVQETLQEWKVKHQREENEYVERLTKERLHQPIRFSSNVRQLRERELGLLRAQRYADAQGIRQQVEVQANIERKTYVQDATNVVEKSLESLRKRNEASRLKLADQASIRWEQLVKSRDDELAQLDKRFHRALEATQRSEKLRRVRKPTLRNFSKVPASTAAVHLVESAARERNVHHMLASSFVPSLLKERGAATALKGQIEDPHISDQCQNWTVGPSRTRPSTAPSSRRRSNLKQRQSRISKRNSSGSSEFAQKCMFCGLGVHKLERCRGTSGFVAIPKEGSVGGGIGQFCTWECAKAWNHARSPLQTRWLRDLFIDEVAGKSVTPRSRAEMDEARVSEVRHFELMRHQGTTLGGNDSVRKFRRKRRKSKTKRPSSAHT